MIQSLATVVIPFPAQRSEGVKRTLDLLGAPHKPTYKRIARKLRRDGDPFVHFMSMVLVPAAEREEHAHLLIELCADGHPREALSRLASAIPGELRVVVRATGREVPETGRLARFLVKRSHDPGPASWRPGLTFSGTPDMSVKRITEEESLARRIRELIGALPPGSALSKLQAVREKIFVEVDHKWAFVSEPVSRVLGEGEPFSRVALALAAFRDFLWPLVLIPVVAFVLSRLVWDSDMDMALWHALMWSLVGWGVATLFALAVYRSLRQSEKNDVPLDVEPPKKDLEEILAYEERTDFVQNHLAGVSEMKPGMVRRVTLRLALWVIGHGASRSRPGFLDRIGSIHFARWLRLPKTNRLVFLSNYDGSWQSYLEDFIARLREGLSSIWSNTRDFPKTAYLVQGGAGDGTRFKRWARRQQVPTRFWYSAYPRLTTHRIRTNAAIRHGFASAMNEQEAAGWLSHLGYAGSDSLETREIPTLAFGGLSRLPFAQCLVVGMPSRESARAWLRSIEADITYGDRMPGDSALVVGFTAGGMEKLGLDPHAMATFPMAFQQGMADARRARALGDDLKTWSWRPAETHAVLLLYNACLKTLEDEARRRRSKLEECGCSVWPEIRTAKLDDQLVEPFGFRDGISQPVMQGTLRASRQSNRMDVVQPGEMVLGYRDNLDKVAPMPRAVGRDIGRNGTFLVVRQLEQDAQAFSDYLAEAAAELIGTRDPRAPTRKPALLMEWIAAKMVGRWKDGTSLVRNPHEPGTARSDARRPDNTFMFGREDPDGLRCPFGAHIRRANPRDSFEPGSQKQMDISNRHRVLRVGRVYVPEKDEKPGLLFMCVNADIERQFEFLQQTWIMGSNFHGLEDEVDPIVGCKGRMTVPTPHGPLRLRPLAQFVTVRGGGYFFMPGRSTLRMLAA